MAFKKGFTADGYSWYHGPSLAKDEGNRNECRVHVNYEFLKCKKILRLWRQIYIQITLKRKSDVHVGMRLRFIPQQKICILIFALTVIRFIRANKSLLIRREELKNSTASMARVRLNNPKKQLPPNSFLSFSVYTGFFSHFPSLARRKVPSDFFTNT